MNQATAVFATLLLIELSWRCWPAALHGPAELTQAEPIDLGSHESVEHFPQTRMVLSWSHCLHVVHQRKSVLPGLSCSRFDFISTVSSSTPCSIWLSNSSNFHYYAVKFNFSDDLCLLWFVIILRSVILKIKWKFLWYVMLWQTDIYFILWVVCMGLAYYAKLLCKQNSREDMKITYGGIESKKRWVSEGKNSVC